jgi:hypothetical protein
MSGEELMDWAIQILPMKRTCLCSKIPETIKEKTALFESMVNFQKVLRFSIDSKKGEDCA